MKSLFTIGAGILFALLGLSGCENNHGDYPKEYIGFDKTIESYTVNRQVEEQEIDIKIIAIEKSQKDREVTLKGNRKPGAKPIFKLVDTRIIIPAKKKSTTARIRIYPKQIKRSEKIYIICTPKNKEVKQSQLTLKLVVK